MVTACVSARVLSGFDDPACAPEQWDRLLRRGDTDVVFLTREWQRAWWESFGAGGELLLVAAERGGEPVALAPLCVERGLVSFIGVAGCADYTGSADYLDFLGDVGDPEVLDAILETARCSVPDFAGFQLYHVRESSRTGERLRLAAHRLGLRCYDEWALAAPSLDVAGQPETALATANKKHLRRREQWLRREGALEVRHLSTGDAILPHLDEFFAQHQGRWDATSTPSGFHDPVQRCFYQQLTRIASDAGWLRFTRIDWEGRPIAFHYGFCYRGSYLCYKPTFDIGLAARAPGQVLFRQLILAAIEEGARTFDLGFGDEAFKWRFATDTEYVHMWGLYPEPRARADGTASGSA